MASNPPNKIPSRQLGPGRVPSAGVTATGRECLCGFLPCQWRLSSVGDAVHALILAHAPTTQPLTACLRATLSEVARRCVGVRATARVCLCAFLPYLWRLSSVGDAVPALILAHPPTNQPLTACLRATLSVVARRCVGVRATGRVCLCAFLPYPWRRHIVAHIAANIAAHIAAPCPAAFTGTCARTRARAARCRTNTAESPPPLPPNRLRSTHVGAVSRCAVTASRITELQVRHWHGCDSCRPKVNEQGKRVPAHGPRGEGAALAGVSKKFACGR
jgi:hypothetical protein